MQQVPDRQNVARFKFGRCATDGRSVLRHLQHRFLGIEFDFPNDLNNYKAGHDLGHACYLTPVILTLPEEYLARAPIHDRPTLGCYERRSQIN